MATQGARATLGFAIQPLRGTWHGDRRSEVGWAEWSESHHERIKRLSALAITMVGLVELGPPYSLASALTTRNRCIIIETEEQVVSEGLRLLEQRDQRMEELRRQVQVGLKQL